MEVQNTQDNIPDATTAQPLSVKQSDIPAENNSLVPLSQKEEKIFDIYAHKYNILKDFSKEKFDNVNRQRYVYSALNSKGIENTAVEQLLNLTISDINHQYTVKNAMESKAGFLVALWGVLLGIILNNKLYITLIYELLNSSSALVWRGIHLLVLLGLITTAFGALIQIAQTLIAGEYSRYKFNDKETNFKCAVDDRNMMFTKLLDANTNVWKKNEDTNERKYRYLKNSVIWIFILIFFIVVSISLKIYNEGVTP